MSLPDVPRHVLAQLRSTAEQVAVTPAGGDIASPCISVCRMNAGAGLCEGCLRTLDEIRQWSRASDDAKRAIWQVLDQRATALEETAS
jgi:predicted Fe-S protein YdhL (DUF1289 family)